MAETPKTQNPQNGGQAPNQGRPSVFYISNKILRVTDDTDYYVHIYIDKEIDVDDIDGILSYGERIKVFKFEGGRSVELLEFSYSNASIYIGKNFAGVDEYITIDVDFGDDTPPLGYYLRDLLEGKISIKEYYLEVLDYVKYYLNETIKYVMEKEQDDEE